MVLTQMYFDEESVDMEANRLTIEKSMFIYPVDSPLLRIWQVTDNPSSVIEKVIIDEIVSKATKLRLNFETGGNLQ